MRLRKVIYWVVGATVLLIAGAWLLLSPTGLRLLTPLLERHASRALGAPVDLEGLVLRWPLEVELARFTAADSDRKYVEVRDISLRLSARQLARGHVWVHALEAGQIAYNGLPAREAPEPAEAPPGPTTWPDPGLLVNRVTVKELRCPHVVLGDDVLSQRATLRVEGAFAPGRDGKALRLHMDLLAWAEMEWPAPPELHVEGALRELGSERWHMTLQADARHWAPLVPDWPEELEDDVHLRLAVLLEDGHLMTLEEAHVQAAPARLDGTGTLDLQAARVQARLEAVVEDAAPFSVWADTDLEGAAFGVLELEGDPATPEVAVTIVSDRFQAGPHEATDLRATLRAEAKDIVSRGEFAVEAVLDEVPVTGTALYQIEQTLVTFRDLRARALGVQVTGEAGFDWESIEARGLIHVEADDMAELAAHWGIEAEGRLELTLRMATENGRQDAFLEAAASSLVLPYGAMDAMQVEASVRDLFDEPAGAAHVTLRGVEAEDLNIQEIEMHAAGDRDSVDIALNGAGELLDPWALTSTASVYFEEGRPTEMAWHDLHFEHRDFILALEESVRVLRRQDRYDVELLALRIGAGRLLASGHVHAEAVELEADVRELPLSTFGFAGVGDAKGEMEGHLRVSGHPANPQAELQVKFSGLMPADTNYWDGPPALFSVSAWLEDQRLSGRFLLEELTGRPVELELEVPLQVSLYPVHLQWPPEGDVSGHLFAETDLGELATLFVLDVHRLAGLLSVDLALSGTVAEPDVSGALQVVDGAYEHTRLGTILKNLEMSVSGQRDRLTIEHLRATDGNDGRVSMSGSLQIRPEDGYPFDAALSLKRFRLLRHDTARATGDGTLTWEGTRHASEVTGRVTVTSMEFRIPERMPAALIDLDVTEINGETDPDDEAIEEMEDELLEEVAAHNLVMDVEVVFPDRAYVRGRGLDSEWGGDVRIQGSAREPDISGSLSILRGRFVFFGKRLGITRGVVTLMGSFPPHAMIDVVAEARSGGITAILRLTGDLDAPEIELDSRPEMPEDEILARLLFGREAARITPWQAITMAQAVNRLRGGGSAFDVMGHTRRILRVDQIELRQAEEDEGHAAVSVGKYISDRIYVELERGLGPEEGGRAKVEVELTPTVRVETEMGTDADAGLDVIWSWDY